MKKFKFSLETVLKIRKRNEEFKLKALGEVVERINHFQLDIQRNENDIEKENQAFAASLGIGSSLHNFTIHQSFLQRLHQENVQFKQKIEAEEEHLNLARMEFSEASKQRKIMDLLKEKRLKEYNEKLSKIEILEMEEFNNNLLNKQRKTVKNEYNKSRQIQFRIHEESDETDESVPENTQSELDKLQQYLNWNKK